MTRHIQSVPDTNSFKEPNPCVSQGKDNFPMLCGPGCACGTTVKTGKWKIVIMLIVIAVGASALFFKEMI